MIVVNVCKFKHIQSGEEKVLPMAVCGGSLLRLIKSVQKDGWECEDIDPQLLIANKDELESALGISQQGIIAGAG